MSLALLTGCSIEYGGETDVRNDVASPTSRAATPDPAPTLAIVTPTPVPPNSTAPAGATGAPTPEQNPATYVVAEGDSLYAIALRFNVELSALIELNGLSDPNDIQAGQELKIPPRQ